MSDIVERLLRWSISTDAVPASDLMDEAAAEITRLRAQLLVAYRLGVSHREPPDQDSAAMSPASAGSLRWIAVKERLPEKGIPVIGWFPGAIQSFECALNEHDGVWCDYGTGIYLYDDERPTHWMPFPEGPTDDK